MSRMTGEVVRDRIATAAANLEASEVDALTNYVVMILVGLSSSAQDGVGIETLQESAEIAAKGFVRRLQ